DGQAAQDGQGVQGGLSGQNGHGGGGLGALVTATLTELLLTALRDGNEVMMRALASLFVERYAGIEPGRPVAGTYYVFRTLRAVDPDRLLARLAGPGEQGPDQAPAQATEQARDQIADMRAVLDPLTRKLASRLAAKRRHKRRGTLDFRRTVRRSLSTGGVPVRPAFRKPHPAKPELFVLADISGSVSTFAAFTLQLAFALPSPSP